MSLDNPYDYSDPGQTQGGDLQHLGILEELRMTRPWVRLVGILGLILCGLMLLSSVGVLFFSLFGGGRGFGALAGMGVGYLIFALIYGYPCVRLLKYGSAITRYEEGQTIAELETALMEQRRFWRFIGICTCAVVGLYLVAILGAALLGAF